MTELQDTPYKTIGEIPLDKLVYVADNLYFVTGDVYKVDVETGNAKMVPISEVVNKAFRCASDGMRQDEYITHLAAWAALPKMLLAKMKRS